jgi:hypothetical protein
MISLILTIAAVGFIVYMIITYIPMADPFKKIIIALAAILIVLYLVQIFGFDIPLPHRR